MILMENRKNIGQLGEITNLAHRRTTVVRQGCHSSIGQLVQGKKINKKKVHAQCPAGHIEQANFDRHVELRLFDRWVLNLRFHLTDLYFCDFPLKSYFQKKILILYATVASIYNNIVLPSFQNKCSFTLFVSNL